METQGRISSSVSVTKEFKKLSNHAENQKRLSALSLPVASSNSGNSNPQSSIQVQQGSSQILSLSNIETKYVPYKRRDYDFHQFVKALTESSIFNHFIIFFIVMNSLILGLETSSVIKNKYAYILGFLDELFTGIYAAEFTLKLYSEPKNYWKSYYNWFDFLVLMVSYSQIVIPMFFVTSSSSINIADWEGLKIFRAFRTLRTLRTVSFIKGLQVLVKALVDTIRKWLVNIILLLVLLMYIFGIMGHYFFGQIDGDQENWGTIQRAMLSLFSYVTVDGWTDIQDNLDNIEAIWKGGSRIFTIFFIFLGNFIFTNVFIGVIIMNISTATEMYQQKQMVEKKAIVEHKKQELRQRQFKKYQEVLEKHRKGRFQNIEELFDEYSKSLPHNSAEMIKDLCGNKTWMEMSVFTMHLIDDSLFTIQQLYFEIANVLMGEYENRLRRNIQVKRFKMGARKAKKYGDESRLHKFKRMYALKEAKRSQTKSQQQ